MAVQPGARLCATAWAEGWSNDGLNLENANKDNPRWSEGLGVGLSAFYAEEGAVTDDAARNALRCGPTNTTMPTGMMPS